MLWEGEIHFRNLPELKTAPAVYGVAYVYAPATTAVTLLVGGAAPLELSLNGRPVYRWKSYSSHYNLDRVPVLLQPGRNTLRLKLTGPVENKGFIFRLGDSTLDRGLELAYGGMWDEALPLLKAAFVEPQQRERGANAWLFYGRSLFLSGDEAGYQEFRRQALEWAPTRNSPDTNLQISSLCALTPLSSEDAAKVVKMVDEGVAKSSTKSSWMNDYQTVVYFRAGRYEEVLARIGKRGGTSWTAMRALCHFQLGNLARAEAELESAEKQFPDIFTMQEQHAASARCAPSRHGILDWVFDIVLLREAAKLMTPDRPLDESALNAWLAAVRKQLEAADQRLLSFEMALIYDGKNPQRWLERGRARAEMGDWKLAKEDFIEAVAMAPTDPEVRAARIRVYASLERMEEAAADVLMMRDDQSELAKSANWSDVSKQLETELPQWPALVERLKVPQRD